MREVSSSHVSFSGGKGLILLALARLVGESVDTGRLSCLLTGSRAREGTVRVSEFSPGAGAGAGASSFITMETPSMASI